MSSETLESLITRLSELVSALHADKVDKDTFEDCLEAAYVIKLLILQLKEQSMSSESGGINTISAGVRRQLLVSLGRISSLQIAGQEDGESFLYMSSLVEYSLAMH